MTTFITHPNADGMVKFKGFIRNLKQTRASASFVLTETDKYPNIQTATDELKLATQ